MSSIRQENKRGISELANITFMLRDDSCKSGKFVLTDNLCKCGDGLGRLGYYDAELLLQHEAEARRRYRLRKEILRSWRADAKIIRQENESMLQKEARREALAIIEDSARTVEEFEKVTILWDCLDIIERWRLGKHEPKRTEILVDGELVNCDAVIPPPMEHAWWRQLSKGKFLDVIHDCPHEVQDLTSSRSAYELIKELSEKQKEILYYWAIRLWTPQRIATFRGQTDRNIRKVYTNMMENIRQKMFWRLYPRYVMWLPLTFAQFTFVEWYIAEYDEGEIRPEKPDDKDNTSAEADKSEDSDISTTMNRQEGTTDE